MKRRSFVTMLLACIVAPKIALKSLIPFPKKESTLDLIKDLGNNGKKASSAGAALRRQTFLTSDTSDFDFGYDFTIDFWVNPVEHNTNDCMLLARVSAEEVLSLEKV